MNVSVNIFIKMKSRDFFEDNFCSRNILILFEKVNNHRDSSD